MSPNVTRRRLLSGLGGIVAVGVGGWAAVARLPRSEPGGEAAGAPSTSPSLPAPSTTRPTEATTTSVAVPSTTTTTEPPARIDVICRAAWGAADPAGEMIPHTIARLTLHHTAALLTDNADAPARARAHQRFHLDSGFADLAYHFMVDLEGNVLEGRSVDFAGETFTDYDPAGHFLVCCEGNYDTQEPTPQQLESVARLFAWASRTYDVDVSTLAGHRDHASTSCPGDHLYARLEDGTLAAAVTTVLALGVERNDLCGRVGADAIAAIESA